MIAFKISDLQIKVFIKFSTVNRIFWQKFAPQNMNFSLKYIFINFAMLIKLDAKINTYDFAGSKYIVCNVL